MHGTFGLLGSSVNGMASGCTFEACGARSSSSIVGRIAEPRCWPSLIQENGGVLGSEVATFLFQFDHLFADKLIVNSCIYMINQN